MINYTFAERELCFPIQLTFKLGFNRNNLLDFINNWFNFINNRFDNLVSFDDYFLDFINYLNFKFFNFFYYLLDFIRYLLNYFLLGYAFVCFFNVFCKMQDDNTYLAYLRVRAKKNSICILGIKVKTHSWELKKICKKKRTLFQY